MNPDIGQSSILVHLITDGNESDIQDMPPTAMIEFAVPFPTTLLITH